VRKVCCISILSLFYFAAGAQNIASVNGKSITSKEFMWVYKKNHANNLNSGYQELIDYLNLYINFKLKVLDARANGLDTDTAYKAEIKGYESALKAQKKTTPHGKDYEFIMNEYREGVLMFNISEKHIWNKVTDNEDELKDYYLKNKASYDGKDFEESKGQVLLDYQKSLENEWITSLRAKYIVKINEDEVKKLAKP
jgi:hypothetical protein